MSVSYVLLLVALVSFGLAIPPIPSRINLVALGLFCLVLIQVLGGGVVRL